MADNDLNNKREQRVKDKLNLYFAKDVVTGIRRNIKLQHINPFQTARGVNMGDGSLL